MKPFIRVVRSMLVIMLVFLSTSLLAQDRRDYLQRLDEEYTSALFRSTDAYYLTPMDDPAADAQWNVFAYLQGRVPGLMVYVGYPGRPFVVYRNARPAYFLDELRVDPSLFNTINLQDVALIKVFRPPFLGAVGNGAGGAIAVYTKRGEEE